MSDAPRAGLPALRRDERLRCLGMLAVSPAGLARAPKNPSGRSLFGHGNRSRFTGCMVYLTMSLIAVVALAFRAGQVVGMVIMILSIVIFALAISLFTICMTIRVI